MTKYYDGEKFALLNSMRRGVGVPELTLAEFAAAEDLVAEQAGREYQRDLKIALRREGDRLAAAASPPPVVDAGREHVNAMRRRFNMPPLTEAQAMALAGAVPSPVAPAASPSPPATPPRALPPQPRERSAADIAKTLTSALQKNSAVGVSIANNLVHSVPPETESEAQTVMLLLVSAGRRSIENGVKASPQVWLNTVRAALKSWAKGADAAGGLDLDSMAEEIVSLILPMQDADVTPPTGSAVAASRGGFLNPFRGNPRHPLHLSTRRS